MHAEDHEPDDILTALRMGTDYSFTIKVRSLVLKVRPLSIAEHVRIVNEIQAEMSTKPKNEQNGLTESSIMAMKVLELATTPEPGSKIAPAISAYLMSKMTNDEISALYNAYNSGCERLNPGIEDLTKDQLDTLVEAAKKNGSEVLAELQPRHLVNIIHRLLTLDA